MYSNEDMWADMDTLASAGWGTDEDYGYYAEDTWSDDDFDSDEDAGEWWNGMAEDAAMEAGLFGWDA